MSTGFFRQKSKSLIGMAQALVDEHGGQVPADMDALTSCPASAARRRTSCSATRSACPGLPVDRHVLRVSNRIGIAEGDDPGKVEAQLCAALPTEMWTLASDVQILHGRRICRPKPLCDQCPVRDDCDYYAARRVAPSEADRARRKPATKTAAQSRHADDPRRVRTPRR